MKKKKKSSWMKGFVIPPRVAEVDIVLFERRAETIDSMRKKRVR